MPAKDANKAKQKEVKVVETKSADLALLPVPVARLREKILEAAQSGDIEKLRSAIEFNEVPPLFEKGTGKRVSFAESIAYLKSRSFDGKGKEWLTILRAIFEAAYVKEERGPFVSYDWPSFAFAAFPPETDEEKLTLWRCVRFADLAATNAAARPLVQRARIGADGTWHYLWAES
jgi:hypothetical protein